MFARVSHSKTSYTPTLFWRQNLSKLDRRAYNILASLLVEENSLKSLSKKENDLAKHREGRRLAIGALREYHRMLTTEIFDGIISQISLRAVNVTRARS